MTPVPQPVYAIPNPKMKTLPIILYFGCAIASSLAQANTDNAGLELATNTAFDADQTIQEVLVTGDNNAATLRKKNSALDTDRDNNLLPKFGATTFNINEEAIDTLPQGKNTAIDKMLLQAPGVSYDSAISNPDFHVRNEYANVQYRINGIQLPDGVSGLGPILETGFIGNLNLLVGTLPAQYGQRTAGVVDISTKSEFYPGGSINIYGGSWGTLSPSIEYGGSTGSTQYFFTGRYLQSDQGMENAMPTPNPIHDQTRQGKLFGYGTTLLDDSNRLTYMAGAFNGHFQIPNVQGQAPLGDFGSPTLSSSDMNETETDQFFFGLLALQSHRDNIDSQISVYVRTASAHFMPDIYYDLAFNDVASRVLRKSQLSGMQFDFAVRLNSTNTVRFGSGFNIEQTQVSNVSTVLPLDGNGNPVPTPVTLQESTSKTGWNVGTYIQDEWSMSEQWTLNAGLRYDQMEQFVSARQFSPRIVLVVKPFEETSIHAGVSRYFTPPMQAQATPTNIALYQNTTQQQTITQADPVLPERATYYDIGLDQKISPDLTIGIDTYYKRSTDTLDDGQFGQAVVLTQFNYEHGFSQGLEFKVNYQKQNFRTYLNLSGEITKAKNVVSNQYLIGDPVELAYQAANYTYASDAQTVTASFGTSYKWQSGLISLDGMYGSGLREGFANEQHLPGYTQWNAALAQDIDLWQNHNPTTVRLSAINLFDRSYLLRNGSGIGEFAPQYGPRRGIFISVSQQF